MPFRRFSVQIVPGRKSRHPVEGSVLIGCCKVLYLTVVNRIGEGSGSAQRFRGMTVKEGFRQKPKTVKHAAIPLGTGRDARSYASSLAATAPWTSVRRKWRPANRKVSLV